MGFRTNGVFGKGNYITDGLHGPAKHSLMVYSYKGGRTIEVRLYLQGLFHLYERMCDGRGVRRVNSLPILRGVNDFPAL